jgi:DNA uptake protein ComE-like DNA-binding protein
MEVPMIRFYTLIAAVVLAASFSHASEKKVTSAALKSAAVQKPADPVMDIRTTKGELIDINSASDKQLKALKGIGIEYSERIIAGRPYYTQEQLVTRKVIPREIYETIKDQIIAKQSY